MFITINNHQFEVELKGPETAPVVTLSHSLSTNLRAWEDLTRALLPNYRVLRYSMRGHGKTDTIPGSYTLSELAGDIAAIQEHFGIRRSHLVGLSIGGMIAQTFALEHPDRLDRLVISSSLSGLPEGADALWAERIAAVEQDGLEATVEPTIGRWFVEETHQAQAPVLDYTRDLIRETSPEGYIGCCHAISKLALTERLKTIMAPTLVIVGEGDMGTPVAASEVIADNIPGARLNVIANASHQVAMERPAEFNAAVLEFLKG